LRWGAQAPELRDGWALFSFEEQREYSPLEHPELPSQFARSASDNDALLKFLTTYGRLGWRDLVVGVKGDAWIDRQHADLRELAAGMSGFYAEPRAWLQAHAEMVHWCLSAAHSLRLPQPRARLAACDTACHEYPQLEPRRGTLAEKISLPLDRLFRQASPVNVLGGILTGVMNANMFGVRRSVHHRGDGVLLSEWAGHTLIEAIYTLMADAMTGGRLAQCHSCGAIFLQTDERQRFCPPREGQEKSTCMNRERIRRYRQRAPVVRARPAKMGAKGSTRRRQK
jgi:hypothetical protein